MLPPSVQSPFPLEPSRVNVVAPVTVMVNVPFAAVLPSTPVMETCAPVCSPLASAVVMVMGRELEAPVTAMTAGVGSLAIASLMAWRTTAACVWVKVRELWLADWPRSR